MFGMSPEGGSLLQMLVPLAMVFAIFYFIVIVPSKRQQKKVQEFVDNLKEGPESTESRIYHVFAFAPLPLAFYLGVKLGWEKIVVHRSTSRQV